MSSKRGGGELGRDLVADMRSEPGLDLAGHRRLGDDEGVRIVHASTRQKSRAVRAVPTTEPDTFDRVPRARAW